MKKLFVITMMVLIISSLIFAESTEIDSKSSNLLLSLDGDAYIFGFSSSADFNKEDDIQLNEVIDIDTGTVRLEVKTFYFFYKAITDDPSVKFTINVTPMYLNGTAPNTGSETENAKQTIHYTASINQTSVWDGESFTNEELHTETNLASTACLIKDGSFNNYLTNGIAGIVISSSEALEGKVPGNYKGTITVKMQSGS